jgi:hypothetical protein
VAIGGPARDGLARPKLTADLARTSILLIESIALVDRVDRLTEIRPTRLADGGCGWVGLSSEQRPYFLSQIYFRPLSISDPRSDD